MPQEIKQQVFEVRNTSKKKLSFPDLKQVPPLSPGQVTDLFQYISAADLANSRSFQRHLMRGRIEAKQYDTDPIWGLDGSRGNFYHQYVGKKMILPERW